MKIKEIVEEDVEIYKNLKFDFQESFKNFVFYRVFILQYVMYMYPKDTYTYKQHIEAIASICRVLFKYIPQTIKEELKKRLIELIEEI